jgi:hypothetical protein
MAQSNETELRQILEKSGLGGVQETEEDAAMQVGSNLDAKDVNEQIFELLKFVYDQTAMKQMYADLQFDSSKMPLGIL